MIGIEMRYEREQPSVWLDIKGEVIPPEKLNEITFKYCVPPEKDQALLGNYWWIVRIRPQGGTNKKYEYMINKDYSYSRVAGDFARRKLTLASNRWYFEGPIEKTLNSCLLATLGRTAG